MIHLRMKNKRKKVYNDSNNILSEEDFAKKRNCHYNEK